MSDHALPALLICCLCTARCCQCSCLINVVFLVVEFGFDVLTTPFRDCYEFGGSLHCATCDIRRDDTVKDFFDQEYN